MKKKIAIGIRGHIRNYEKTLDYFYHTLLDNIEHEVIIFIHSWDKINYNNNILIDKEKLILDYKVEDNNYNIEIQQNIDKKNFCSRNKYKFNIQLYSINKLKELIINYEKKNNVTFDYILFTRFDITYYNKLNLYLDKIDDKSILLCNNYTYYDLFQLFHRKNLDIFGNMLLLKYNKIKNKYKSYGVNPIIDFLIKKNNLKIIENNFGFLHRQ